MGHRRTNIEQNKYNLNFVNQSIFGEYCGESDISINDLDVLIETSVLDN